MGNNLNVSIVNEWMSRNYAIIAPKFYDKDALHDALCIIYNLAYLNKIDVNVLSIKTIGVYYHKCIMNKFFTAFVFMPVEDSKLEWIIDKELQDEGDEPEAKDYYAVLEQVKKRMKYNESKILDLYIKGFSIHKIAICMGKSEKSINKVIFNKKIWDSCLSKMAH